MSASQVWNSAVILTFDKGHEAARSLRRFVADKEHAAYGLSEVSQSSETSAVATSTKSDWSQLLRQFFHHNKGASPPDSSASRDALKLTNSEPRDEEDQALVETMAPGRNNYPSGRYIIIHLIFYLYSLISNNYKKFWLKCYNFYIGAD